MKKNVVPILFCFLFFVVAIVSSLLFNRYNKYSKAVSYKDIVLACDKAGFDLKETRKTKLVPRVYFENFPEDFFKIENVSNKKKLFFQTLLPLILHANEEIEKDRNRLLDINSRLEQGDEISLKEQEWLTALKENYKADNLSIQKLLKKVDKVPVSIALAQAAVESGWGTSRFAVEGNAIYGEHTWSGKGMIPMGRETGETFLVKQFDSLYDSIASYSYNLNTGKSYVGMRNARMEAREEDKVFSGLKASEFMHDYSEIDERYIRSLKSVIRQNKLIDFDDAILIGE